MAASNTSTSYGRVTQWLHWLIAALIVAQYVLGQMAANAASDDLALRQLALLANHKSIGITVLLLATVRIGWRWRTQIPQLPGSMPNWQVRLSKLSHFLLYLLIFALPISGWLMSSASAYTVSWFNLVQLPDLLSPSEDSKELLVNIHHLLATTLLLLASAHLLAALKHHFVDRDGVLKRMLSASSAGLFFIVLTTAIWASTTVMDAGVEPPLQAAESIQIRQLQAPQKNSADSDLVAWDIDYGASKISFSAEQAGATFTGIWPDWQADIRFSKDSLETSSAAVEIDVISVSTDDGDRDATLLASNWFAANVYPNALFEANQFSANDDGSFTAKANLTIKNQVSPVEFLFTVTQGDSTARRVLEGRTRLDRLALQLGTGEWADTTWVGRFVAVSVRLEANAKGKAKAQP
jgi:cytochrome b561/polyisoprenoid-binding protein YceI